ncbi:MAG TPA: adenylyl-sulfate kinase, partial [Thermoplasmata archaeon]|nr:adenylyl-sulfate kinase [Thermoplasmata archaeon]
GLYKRARAGQIKDMTGIDDPYEPPETADIVVDAVGLTARESADFILRELERQGWFSATRGEGTPKSPNSHHRATP